MGSLPDGVSGELEMTAVRKQTSSQTTVRLYFGRWGVTAIKKLPKQSCTSAAEAKLSSPEISLPPNFRTKHRLVTSHGVRIEFCLELTVQLVWSYLNTEWFGWRGHTNTICYFNTMQPIQLLVQDKLLLLIGHTSILLNLVLYSLEVCVSVTILGWESLPDVTLDCTWCVITLNVIGQFSSISFVLVMTSNCHNIIVLLQSLKKCIRVLRGLRNQWGAQETYHSVWMGCLLPLRSNYRSPVRSLNAVWSVLKSMGW